MRIGETFNAGDIVDKTLIALVKVPVYTDTVETATPMAFVQAGQPVGVVYAYLAPNPDYGRTILWWQFKTTANTFYYAPQKTGLYDVTAISGQGVLSDEQKAAAQKEADLERDSTWYENLIRNYWKPVAGVAIAMAAVKGYFSRPAK